MGLSGCNRQTGEREKSRGGGTEVLVIRKADEDAVGGRDLVVARGVRAKKVARVSQVGNGTTGRIVGHYRKRS